MSLTSSPRRELLQEAAGVRRGPWTTMAFTGVAGFVDAVSFLALRQVYTANMSGNSVSVGVHAAQGHWERAWERGWPVFAFVLGLILAGILMELGRQ